MSNGLANGANKLCLSGGYPPEGYAEVIIDQNELNNTTFDYVSRKIHSAI